MYAIQSVSLRKVTEYGAVKTNECGLRADCWQLLALLRDSAHMAGSHARKSRKVGTWLAAMCELPAFLLYTHNHNPGTCIRGTPAPGLGAATPGRVILTLRAPPRPVHAGCAFRLLLNLCIEDLNLIPVVSVLLIFASLPDCIQNQTAVSDILRLLSDF
jgi:hypothetical protein